MNEIAERVRDKGERHPNSLANLEKGRWQPGESGNPGGLVRGTPRISTALAKLLRCAQGKPYEVVNKADEIAVALYDKAVSGDVAAISLIFDRVEGKVAQTFNLRAESQSDQEIARLMMAELIESGKEPERARALLLEVGVSADDLD